MICRGLKEICHWNRHIGLHGEEEPAARYKNQIEVIVVSISFAKTKATGDIGIALYECGAQDLVRVYDYL
jgi:hypothetical protein